MCAEHTLPLRYPTNVTEDMTLTGSYDLGAHHTVFSFTIYLIYYLHHISDLFVGKTMNILLLDSLLSLYQIYPSCYVFWSAFGADINQVPGLLKQKFPYFLQESS